MLRSAMSAFGLDPGRFTIQAARRRFPLELPQGFFSVRRHQLQPPRVKDHISNGNNQTFASSSVPVKMEAYYHFPPTPSTQPRKKFITPILRRRH